MICFKKIFLISLFVFPCIFLNAHEYIHEIKEEDALVKILDSNHPVIIMGYMNYCSWCNVTKPHFVELSNKYHAKMKFYLVNGPQLNFAQHVHTFTSNKNHINKNLLSKISKKGILGSQGGIQIPGYPVFICIHKGEIVNLQIGGCTLEILEDLIKQSLHA